jgi:hypothetical protein
LRPTELRVVCIAAADKLTYPEMKAFLQDQLAPEFQELATRLAIIRVSRHIIDLSSLEERRRVIDTYPEYDGNLSGIRSEVKLGVQRLWTRRHHK